MEERINVAELLKDCPHGMELDCTIFNGKVAFEGIDESNSEYPIRISINLVNIEKLNCFGQYNTRSYAQCVIFPKGKTTWEGFVPPCKYKAGDVLVSQSGNIVLLSHIDSENIVNYHCIIPTYGSFRIEENTNIGVGRYYDCVLANEQQRQRMYDRIKCSGYKYNQHINKLEKLVEPKFKDGDILFVDCSDEKYKISKYIFILNKPELYGGWHSYCHLDGAGNFYSKETYLTDKEYHPRFATKEEKEKLFKAIKDNGYRWNFHAKRLEKLIIPNFKKGDKVRVKKGVSEHRIIDDVCDTFYTLVPIGRIDFTDQDNWELVPNKFDITTLKPFESRVLVRDSTTGIWYPEFFGCLFNSNNSPYMVLGGNRWKYCVPYEGNEHLLETNNDCDDYYKTWE